MYNDKTVRRIVIADKSDLSKYYAKQSPSDTPDPFFTRVYLSSFYSLQRTGSVGRHTREYNKILQNIRPFFVLTKKKKGRKNTNQVWEFSSTAVIGLNFHGPRLGFGERNVFFSFSFWFYAHGGAGRVFFFPKSFWILLFCAKTIDSTT